MSDTVHVICTNPDCTEADVPKDCTGLPPDIIAATVCGACQQPTTVVADDEQHVAEQQRADE